MVKPTRLQAVRTSGREDAEARLLKIALIWEEVYFHRLTDKEGWARVAEVIEGVR
jgi:hypothetical protein